MLGPFVVLFGPTGSGKTEALYRLCAGRAEVISADSMQVYRELRIGTAKPSATVAAALPHHLIDLCSLEEYFDLGAFAERSERLIPEIRARGKLPIVAGGTAFYLRGLLYGLPEAPRADAAVRRGLEEELREGGPERLRAELEQVDPVSAERIEAGDSYRVMRALEVYRTTGRPLSQYSRPNRLRRDLDVVVVGLWRERAELYARIDRRVEEMFRSGLAVEVAELLDSGYRGNEPGLRSIGYREFFDALRAGRLQRDELVDREPVPEALKAVLEEIKRNTRRYAKRQLTFFRRMAPVRWVKADDDAALAEVLEAAERGGIDNERGDNA